MSVVPIKVECNCRLTELRSELHVPVFLILSELCVSFICMLEFLTSCRCGFFIKYVLSLAHLLPQVIARSPWFQELVYALTEICISAFLTSQFAAPNIGLGIRLSFSALPVSPFSVSPLSFFFVVCVSVVHFSVVRFVVVCSSVVCSTGGSISLRGIIWWLPRRRRRAVGLRCRRPWGGARARRCVGRRSAWFFAAAASRRWRRWLLPAPAASAAGSSGAVRAAAAPAGSPCCLPAWSAGPPCDRLWTSPGVRRWSRSGVRRPGLALVSVWAVPGKYHRQKHQTHQTHDNKLTQTPS